MLPPPSLDGGFHLKVVAFIARKTGFLDSCDREDIEALLNREIPHFRSYCLDFEPELDIKSTERTGIKPYWDPVLVEDAAMTSVWSSRLIHLFNENSAVEIEEGKYIALRHHDLTAQINDDSTAAGQRLWGKMSNVHSVPSELASRWPHIVKLYDGDLWVFRDGPAGLSIADKEWPVDFRPVETTKALSY